MPKGYRAPVYNLTQEVIDLLIEYDFDYDSSMMADDIPYVIKTSEGELIEMPVHWGTDDWPPFAHYDEIGYMMPVRSPSAGLAGFWEEFDAQYEAGGFFMLIVHPFLTGRLARWRMVEQWLEKTLDTHDVWFAPLADICAHVKAAHQNNDQKVRVESLPYYDGPQAWTDHDRNSYKPTALLYMSARSLWNNIDLYKIVDTAGESYVACYVQEDIFVSVKVPVICTRLFARSEIYAD